MENSLFQKSLAALVLLAAIIVFALFSFWAPASSFMTSTVLFVDEGDNFFLSRQGPLAVITTYENPNNHVFFTLLQSILPESLFFSNPLLLRLNNFIFVVLALVLLAYTLNKYAKFPLAVSTCIAVALLTISPVQAPFFLYARGYVLGLVLLIGGCISLVKERSIFLSAFIFSLSFWTIPTYGYILPGILAARFCRYWGEEKLVENLARTILLGLMIVAITALFYAPIVKDVILASQLPWLQDMAYSGFVSFLYGWAGGFGQPSSSRILAPIFIVLMIYWGSRVLRNKSADVYWTALLACMSLSYITVVIMLDILDISKPPFARNGMFTYTFAWMALLVSASLMHRLLRIFLVLVFAVFTLLNIQAIFFSPIQQILTEGKPYTLFDHIRDIDPENIKTVIAGPQVYPVISMLTLENTRQAGNDRITLKKIAWGNIRAANRIFAGECDEKLGDNEKKIEGEWENKALILTRTRQKMLLCY